MKIRKQGRAVFAALAAGILLSCEASASPGGTPEKITAGEEDSLTGIFERARQQEASDTGEDIRFIPDSRFTAGDRKENDLRVISAAGRDMARDNGESEFYVIGVNYMPEGSALASVYGDALEYSSTTEAVFQDGGDTYTLVRFALRRTDAQEEQSGTGQEGTLPDGRVFWRIGDRVLRKLGDTSYTFRCIDDDYGSGDGEGMSGALFLCESVIPANTGSRTFVTQRGDGSMETVFHEGPAVNFGDSSEYRDSRIRSWLISQEGCTGALPVPVGVTYGCRGETGEGEYGRFDAAALRFCPVGSQTLTDGCFILSLEEALKYRDELWKVNGYQEEECGEAAGPFARGYWLRTPFRDGSEKESGQVYVVDLVKGNLHPQQIRPDGETDDPELAVTSPYGIRPAFVLPSGI